MTFQDAQLRLLAYVRDRIRNGELTERGFARRIGVSQSHAHNVLKGFRFFSPGVLDAVLKNFHLSLLDLVPEDRLEAHFQQQKTHEKPPETPLWDTPIGPGMPWPARIPPVVFMAKLAPDPQMFATLGQADMALLDTSTAPPRVLDPEGLYAVCRGGEAVLRYVRPGRRVYYLVTDATMNQPSRWEPVPVAEGELLELVKARVLWLGREQDRALPMRQRGRFLFKPISS